mmetsp:Transcript_43951/g.80312  ORF Transcript_43951/g.80312 Transcript_43951/m.80312 type:complete len:143 (-) Transcript_43951:85-513(-)
MGAEASQMCSMTKPHGFEPDCTMSSMQRREEGFEETPFRPMQVSSYDAVQKEKINAWTKDVPDPAACSLAQMANCSKPLQAPQDYLADTQDSGRIILDSREGPVWMDDKDEELVKISNGKFGPADMKGIHAVENKPRKAPRS